MFLILESMIINWLREKYVIFLSLIIFSIGCSVSVQADYSSDSVEVELPIVFGNEQITLYVPYLKGKKVALVVNKASAVDGVHLCDTLLSAGVDVVKIFAPEHGFRADADAGEGISDDVDAQTGLPIVSLYGKNKKPQASQLSDVDVVVYDLQDVGVRFYTYISTLHYVMEACAENGKVLVVLDRPNPNGDYIDGPVLDIAYRSFVGMDQIPIVYGLTSGELAAMINGEKWLANGVHCNLKVVAMKNYSHSRRYDIDIAPSPNLKTPHAIRLYPSLCFFEATNVSVGRGTEWPFEVIGAPDIDNQKFSFVPQSTIGSKNPLHNGKECYGDDLRNADIQQKLSLSYFLKYHSLLGEKFWQNEKFFDLLAGNNILRKQINEGLTEDSIRATWEPQLNDYKQKRQKYLLYDVAHDEVKLIKWTEAMHSHWVDSVYASMSVGERVGQLIWIALDKDPTEKSIKRACDIISKYNVGGVLLLQMSVNNVVGIVDTLSSYAKYPLLIAVDGENGLAMRMTDVIVYPKNNILGEIGDTVKLEKLGKFIGQQMRACGINVNFAPVVDVNTNPKNPIIGNRSFGATQQLVSTCGKVMARGMQAEGVVSVVKHFPGHGDTDTDSHLDLPIVKHSRERMDSIELMPFKSLVNEGVMGVMSAHLIAPSLDETNKAASLSDKMLNGILRNEYKFDGLIISDAMNMQGAKIAGKGMNLETAALLAGNDVVEFSVDVPNAVKNITKALTDSVMTEKYFEEKVRRVLATKEWCGLSKGRYRFGDPAVIINSIEAELFLSELNVVDK